MARKFSPKFRAEAVRLLRAGVTVSEIQAQLRKRFKLTVSEGALRKWRDAANAEPESAPPPPPPPVAPPEPDAEPLDTYERVMRRRARLDALAEEAAQIGNMTAAQRFSKQAVDLDLLIARLDKDRKTDTDAVTIPRAELERRRQAMVERVTALIEDLRRTGGLACPHCGREIRTAIARGDKEGT